MLRVGPIIAVLGLSLVRDCAVASSVHPLFRTSERLASSRLQRSWTSGGDSRLVWTLVRADSGTYVLSIADSTVTRLWSDSVNRALLMGGGDSILAHERWSADVLLRRARELQMLRSGLADTSIGAQVFVVQLGRIGERNYLDIAPALFGASSGTASGDEVLDHVFWAPVHWFWRVTLDAGHLRLWQLSEDWLDDRLRDSARLVQHTRLTDLDSTAILLTAGTEELQHFVSTHAGVQRAFEGPIWLDPWPVRRAAPGAVGTPRAAVAPAVASAWGCRIEDVEAMARTADSLRRIVPQPTPSAYERFAGRDATPCHVLAFQGAPTLVDSASERGALRFVEWWYRDPDTGWWSSPRRFARENNSWRPAPDSRPYIRLLAPDAVP